MPNKGGSTDPSTVQRRKEQLITAIYDAERDTKNDKNQAKVRQLIQDIAPESEKGLNLSKQALGKVKNSRHRHRLEEIQKKQQEAIVRNIQNEVLLPGQSGFLDITDSRGILTTRHVKQADLFEQASATVQAKAIHLQRQQYGPYSAAYTKNGAFLLLTGKQGHVVVIDWRKGAVVQEYNNKEQINDACFLHDHTFFAVAQKRFLTLYDQNGTEIHNLRHPSLEFPTHLDFLPYHFLLVTGTKQGFISWRDISTGELVTDRRTKLGPVCAMRQNPSNAVMCAGHNNGVITMWTPNMTDPVVQIKAHYNGQINDLVVDQTGRYITSVGTDKLMRIYDIRTFQELRSVALPNVATSIDLSDNNLIGIGAKQHMMMYDLVKLINDASHRETNMNNVNQRDNHNNNQQQGQNIKAAPYLHEQFNGNVVNKVRFVPFEDLCGVGFATSFRHCIIPGAGAANFDSWEANPFQTSKQRQESAVKGLLEKLSPDMITVDNHVFNVMRADDAVQKTNEYAKTWHDGFKHEVDQDKNRARDNYGKKQNRKRLPYEQQQHEQRTEAAHRELDQHVAKKQREADAKNQRKIQDPNYVPSALDRFF